MKLGRSVLLTVGMGPSPGEQRLQNSAKAKSQRRLIHGLITTPGVKLRSYTVESNLRLLL